MKCKVRNYKFVTEMRDGEVVIEKVSTDRTLNIVWGKTLHIFDSKFNDRVDAILERYLRRSVTSCTEAEVENSIDRLLQDLAHEGKVCIDPLSPDQRATRHFVIQKSSHYEMY